MKTLLVYRTFCNRVSVPDDVYDALVDGGQDPETEAFIDNEPFLKHTQAGNSLPWPDDEVVEELEVLPAG